CRTARRRRTTPRWWRRSRGGATRESVRLGADDVGGDGVTGLGAVGRQQLEPERDVGVRVEVHRDRLPADHVRPADEQAVDATGVWIAPRSAVAEPAVRGQGERGALADVGE